MSKALVIVSKLDVGLPSGKLKEPPKTCMPSSAKIKMNKKRRNRRDMMDEMAFMRAITRFRKLDQYLRIKVIIHCSVVCRYLCRYFDT